MKDDIFQKQEEDQEKDSLIANKIIETKASVSAKEKLESMVNKQKQDFLDVYDLVGSFQYKQTKSKAEIAESYFRKNYPVYISEVSESKEHSLRKGVKVGKYDIEEEEDDKILDDEIDLDARASSHYSNRYMFQYFSFFSINLFQLATAFLYYEVDFKIFYVNFAEKYLETLDTKQIDIVKSEVKRLSVNLESYQTIQAFTLSTFYLTTFLIVISSTLLYLDEIKWKRSLLLYSDLDTFLTSPGFKGYLMETFFLCIFPISFLNGIQMTNIDIYIDYRFQFMDTHFVRKLKINYIIMTIFIVSRVLILVKFLLIFNYYWSPRSQRFCKIFGVDLDFTFVFKSILRSFPFTVFFVSAAIIIIVGSYLMMIFERLHYMTPYTKLNNYSSCFYYSLITMMTVGYGDKVAVSIIGRIIIAFVALGGVFILAMSTVIFTDIFTFKGGQLKSFNLLKQIYAKEEILERVKELIVKSGNIIITTRRKKKNIENLLKIKSLEKETNRIKKTLFKNLENIINLTKKYENSREYNYLDLFTDQLVFVKNQLKEIDEKIVKFSLAIEMSNENKREIITIKNNLVSDQINE